jgi:hypothetical protein
VFEDLFHILFEMLAEAILIMTDFGVMESVDDIVNFLDVGVSTLVLVTSSAELVSTADINLDITLDDHLGLNLADNSFVFEFDGVAVANNLLAVLDSSENVEK